MAIYDEFKVFGWSWFRIHFTENEGMAFGVNFGNGWGKLALSLFRIAAVFGIGFYLYRLIQNKAKTGVLVCIAMIWAGALGNIIDGALYGILFSDSGTLHNPRVADFLPAEGGYAPFLYGKVVDMFYFPIAEGTYPEWFPFWGGQRYQFFRPIFNIADVAITVGVFVIIIYYRRFFKDLMLYPKNDIPTTLDDNIILPEKANPETQATTAPIVKIPPPESPKSDETTSSHPENP